MATLKMTTPAGKALSSVELDESLFGVEPHMQVLHQVVTAQLAARRAGTQSTKTRAEVRGGGAKPWRQKGTGKARQGSIRSPQWRGGGVAHGPKPRSYKQRTPKKMIRLALASALSDRFASERIIVLKDWGLEAPSTKGAAEVLKKLDLDGRVLIVLHRENEVVWKSLRNLQGLHVLVTGELNAYDILVSDWLIFTEDSLPTPRGASNKTDDDKAEASAKRSTKDRGLDTAGAAEGLAQAKEVTSK